MSLFVIEFDRLLIYDIHDLDESVDRVELSHCSFEYKINEPMYIEKHFVIQIKNAKDGKNITFAVDNKESLEKWKSYFEKVPQSSTKNI